MAHVQSVYKSSTPAGTTDTQAITGVVAGNCLWVFTRTTGGDISGVTSSVDGAFTLLNESDNGTQELKAFYIENASAGSHTITYTNSTAGQTTRWFTAEYDDVPASGIVDDSDIASFTSSTTPASQTITTTDTNRTAISVIGLNATVATIVPNGGETERLEGATRFQLQDEAVASAGSYSASWLLSAAQAGVAIVIALKPAGVAGPVPPPTLVHTIRNVLLRM